MQDISTTVNIQQLYERTDILLGKIAKLEHETSELKRAVVAIFLAVGFLAIIKVCEVLF